MADSIPIPPLPAGPAPIDPAIAPAPPTPPAGDDPLPSNLPIIPPAANLPAEPTPGTPSSPPADIDITPPIDSPAPAAEMTTLIENGKTLVVPLPKTNPALPEQTALGGDWAGLGGWSITKAEENAAATPVPVPVDAGDGGAGAEVPGATATSTPGGSAGPTIGPSPAVPTPMPVVQTPATAAVLGKGAAGEDGAVLPGAASSTPLVLSPSPSTNAAPPGPPGMPAAPREKPKADVPEVLQLNNKPADQAKASPLTPLATPAINIQLQNDDSPPLPGPLLSFPPKSTLAKIPSSPPLSLIHTLPKADPTPIRGAAPFQASTTRTSTTSMSAASSTTTTGTSTTSTPDTSTTKATQTVWDLIGSATSGTGLTALSSGGIKALETGGMLNQGGSLALGEGKNGVVLGETGTGPTNLPASQPSVTSPTADTPAADSSPNANGVSKPTLPAPGSPDESNVRALVSSSVTLSGSAAISAIKAGATQLESVGSVSKGEMGEPGLNGFVIGGIVVGGLLLLIVIAVIWSRWRRKKNKVETEDVQSERKRPDTGLDFSDDPITAKSGRFNRVTAGHGGDGPFDDRYQSQYGDSGRESWYRPNHTDQPSQQQEDDGYPYFKNMAYDPQAAQQAKEHGYEPRHDAYYSHGQDPADLGMNYDVEDARRESANPFEPPVSLAARQSSYSTRSRDPRPTTGMTDIYEPYDSRPTSHIDREEDDRDLPAQTPATSSLLPWLSKTSPMPTPPVPDLPRERRQTADVPNDVEDEYEAETPKYTGYGRNAAGVGAARGEQAVGRARPVMAQTPAGAGENGFNTMIPGFR